MVVAGEFVISPASGHADAENEVHPGNERTVTNVWDKYLCLVVEPFLIAKKQENDHHRCSQQMVVKIVF
jgi:hypothetical protein